MNQCSTTLVDLLTAMKQGEDIPLPIIADALRDEGREVDAVWLLTRTRLQNSINHAQINPESGYNPYPLRFWFQVTRTDANTGNPNCWLGGYAKDAYVDRSIAIKDYADFLWKVLVSWEIQEP